MLPQPTHVRPPGRCRHRLVFENGTLDLSTIMRKFPFSAFEEAALLDPERELRNANSRLMDHLRRSRPDGADDLGEFIGAARGAVEVDLLLRGGRVVNVFT